MKLYDGKKVIIGLAAFLMVACLPIWYNLASGKTVDRPQLELPDPKVHPTCVEPAEYMRGNHMHILNEWRNRVVRKGEREYTSKEYGTKHDMSLTRTCLDCHNNHQKFCGQCHDYMGVDPYCWDCHLTPEDIAP